MGTNPAVAGAVEQEGSATILIRSHHPGFELETTTSTESRYNVSAVVAGDGLVSAGPVRVVSPQGESYDRAEMVVSAALEAMPGPRTVIFTISPKGTNVFNATYTLPKGLLVKQSPKTRLVSLSPSEVDSGAEGVGLTAIGANTHFGQGTRFSFPLSGIVATVSSAPTDPARADAVLSVSHTIVPGTYSATVITERDGYEEVTLVGGLTVRASKPLTLEPAKVKPGEPTVVRLTSSGTRFTASPTRVLALDPEVKVEQVQVVSDTELTSVITATAAAPADRDVVLKVSSGVDAAVGALDVFSPSLRAAPRIVSRGAQGTIRLSAIDATFPQGASVSITGAGVSVVSATAIDSSQLELLLDVEPTAELGRREVSAQTSEGTLTVASGIEVTEAGSVPEPPPCGCGAGGPGLAWLGLAATFAHRRRNSGRRRRRAVGGFTLIELMAAGSVLAIGILGTVAAVLSASKTNERVRGLHAASALANRLAERTVIENLRDFQTGANFADTCFQESEKSVVPIPCGTELRSRQFMMQVRVSPDLCNQCSGPASWCSCPANCPPNPGGPPGDTRCNLHRAFIRVSYDGPPFNPDLPAPLTIEEWADPCQVVDRRAGRLRGVCLVVDRRE
ncbi:MAG: type IV pilus modification PilV family protein [Myxococcota bacterium]